jgi:shikimate dehydrogenase
MHVAEAESLGLRLTYDLFDLDAAPARWRDLGSVLDDAEARGFAGLNITYPFKQAVIPLLSELSRTAARLGAVNTVLFGRGGRLGDCTDGYGFAENLSRGLPDAPLGQVIQLGAGGAGAAVADALLESGVRRLVLFDVDEARAASLASRLGALFRPARVAVGQDLAAELAAADGLVNATPVGMAASPGSPVPAALLRPGLWVADIVYVPLDTQLLRDARQAGCRVLDGGGMAVYQAARAFRLFTGQDPDPERMRSRFLTDIRAGR